MSALAAISTGISATNAGSGLIGTIANAVISGEKLKLQKEALHAQIKFQEFENSYNRDKFQFDKENLTKWRELAQEQQQMVYRLNTEGPALRAHALINSGIRTNLLSNGSQLTFSEVQQANASAAQRYYNPSIGYTL